MGAVVYLLVAVFVWPRSTVDAFNEASRKLWVTQASLFRTYLDLMSGKGSAEDSRPLRLKEIQLLTQVGQLLNAAETDSYSVWEVRHQWRHFCAQSAALMEALERWREGFSELKSLDVTTLLPNLAAMGVELDRRFNQIEGMLAGKAPDETPQPMTLTVERAKMHALPRFEEAAVVVTKVQLDKFEALSRSLFDCVADIKGYAQLAAAPAPEPTRRSGLAIDPDRVRAAVMVVATLWIAFFLWVYVDPPGHSAFVMLAGIFALIIAMVPPAGPILLFLSWGGGVAFAGALNIFVMPHLSGFTQLAALIFGAFFVMHYLLASPSQTTARMFTMASFLILIGIDNQQTYSFSQYANNVVWILLSLALAVAVASVITSPRPEKVFLRLLRRYFRQAEFVMGRLALDWEHDHGRAGRLQMAFFRNDLLELPAKLAAIGRDIDYRMLSDNTLEQVQALVVSLQALAYRIKEVDEAHGHLKAEWLVKELVADLRAWRVLAEEHFGGWADDLVVSVERGIDFGERLAMRRAEIETHIDETLRQAGEGELSDEDLLNFYHVLGSYRGLMEAMIGYVNLADDINWARWQEARF